MRVKATCRVINPQIILRIAVKEVKIRHYKNEKNKQRYAERMGNFKNHTMECSQCHHLMKKSIALAQIENKRENAPICVACIMGIPRSKDPKKSLDFKSGRMDAFKDFVGSGGKNKYWN